MTLLSLFDSTIWKRVSFTMSWSPFHQFCFVWREEKLIRKPIAWHVRLYESGRPSHDLELSKGIGELKISFSFYDLDNFELPDPLWQLQVTHWFVALVQWNVSCYQLSTELLFTSNKAELMKKWQFSVRSDNVDKSEYDSVMEPSSSVLLCWTWKVAQ